MPEVVMMEEPDEVPEGRAKGFASEELYEAHKATEKFLADFEATKTARKLLADLEAKGLRLYDCQKKIINEVYPGLFDIRSDYASEHKAEETSTGFLADNEASKEAAYKPEGFMVPKDVFLAADGSMSGAEVNLKQFQAKLERLSNG